MPELLLAAETGRIRGSRPSRRLRREGKIPAVVYGPGGDPMPIAVDRTALRAAVNTDAGLNALITLDIGGSKQLSIVRDLQRHPVRREVLHVDFLRIDPDTEVEVEVPLVLTGEAKLVTQASGMVDQVLHSLPVLAKPADIPIELHADVSALEVGNSLRVGEIEMPPGVRPAVDLDAPFAVGLITRSTKEFMRRERQEAEAAADEELAAGEPEPPADDES
ncbi:MAG: 50S ribosomal protein L25 [Acidimicrobiales bacterium]